MDDQTSTGTSGSDPGPRGDEENVLDGGTWWTRDRTHWWDGSKWRSARETPPNPHVRAGGDITPPPLPVGRPSPPPPAPDNTEPARPIMEITVSAGTAFKIGFFGAIGFVVVIAVLWLFLIVTFGSLLAVGRQ